MYELVTALVTVAFYVLVGIASLIATEAILACGHALERKKQRRALDRLRRP